MDEDETATHSADNRAVDRYQRRRRWHHVRIAVAIECSVTTVVLMSAGITAATVIGCIALAVLASGPFLAAVLLFSRAWTEYENAGQS